jgi:hypothetical protein
MRSAVHLVAAGVDGPAVAEEDSVVLAVAEVVVAGPAEAGSLFPLLLLQF